MALESCTTRSSSSTITGMGPLLGLRQLVLFSETPRYGLDLETFMGERHARAPAEGSEAAVRLGACEVVKGDRHVCRQVLSNKHFRKSAVCSENDYCCPPIAIARPSSLSDLAEVSA